MTKSRKRKAPTFLVGIWTIKLFVASIAAAGINAWHGSDLDTLSKLAAMMAAGLTALVIMFTVEAIGRSWATLGLLPLLAVCATVQAMTFEQSFKHYVEHPAKAAYEASLQPLVKELDRVTKLADTAQAAVDGFKPETVDCSPCRNTRREAAERDAQRLAPLSAALETAKADRKAALDKLETARKAYVSPADPTAVLIIGALLDIAAAFGIWALEATKRRLQMKKTAKVTTKRRAYKPRQPNPIKGFKPYVAINNT